MQDLAPRELPTATGRVPLFPLPNIVLFPHALLPLQIFEPRYRQMTEDALVGDQLIAMAKLKSGWEGAPHDPNPAIHSVVGVGRIVGHRRLDDGRFHLLLHGLQRARIVEEVPNDRLYRTARITWCPDESTGLSSKDERVICQELVQQFRESFPVSPTPEALEKLIASRESLGTICDLMAAAGSLPPQITQELLEELQPLRRAMLLRTLLKQRAATERSPVREFPPLFSRN